MWYNWSMDKDSLKERINCLRNEMTHLWGTTFLFGGTSLMLLLRGISNIERAMGILGFIVAYVLFRAYFIRYNEIKRLINKMEENKF